MSETDITITSGAVTLRGSLTGSAASPGRAALLISGSGPIDRDSNAKRLSINVMRQIATHLSADGVASLRYDKRGVGESEGEYLSSGFLDNIADARAALEVLRSRPEVDPDQIVVIGHSEGALIASALAVDEHLAGVVLLAGAAQNGEEVLRWQARQIAPTLPRPVRWLLKLTRQDIVRTQTKRLERIKASTEDVIRIQFVRLNAKWFREFMTFEPAEALRKAAVPVLAVTGSKDIQVDPADVGVMELAVPSPFTGHVIDDVTHLLRREPGPASLRTYKKQARRPIDGQILELLTDWIVAQSDSVLRDRPGG
ncbi:MAG: lysophospholipase [Acidimicrobiia bacterium]|nr:lysophospholipase [Acidimicrobiia bacterium]MBT8192764.1 lysophospholipase [Acidimicrobiia bacterium]